MNADTSQLKTPGLYLHGLEPGPNPPILSGITGFVGVTEKGPLNQPRPIKNWGEFVDTFGGFISYGYLPRSVFGFFLNGGELCYVVRVRRVQSSTDLFSAEDTGKDPGFINAQGILNDKDNNGYIKVTAENIKGSAGNNIRIKAVPFETPTALNAPQEKDGKNFIVVHNVEAFEGDDLQTFTIDNSTESITLAKVEKTAHHLVLDKPMSNKYPIGSIIRSDTRFNLEVWESDSGDPLEIFYNLSMDPASGRYFTKIIKSIYIKVDHAAAGSPLCPEDEIQLAGGKDPGQIDYRYYTGYENDGSYFQPSGIEPGRCLGLATLEQVEDVGLVAVPDLGRGEGSDSIDFKKAQEQILFHCRKMGERFAVLDPIEASERYAVFDPVKEKVIDSSPVFLDPGAQFGALYYPWVYAVFEEKKEPVPPSGIIAGIMARTDRQYGPHKAPANVKLKGVVDLETLIDSRLQEVLNKAGINCIRKFEDGIIKVWGARTLSLAEDRKWRYVNIRRTFLFIIKTLSKKLLWAVFEPNDRGLWKRIESSITAFFATLTAKGMTAGTGPGDAFYVKCNRETNPKEVVGAGRVIAEVGVALSAPAEFIVITVKKNPESLQVIEEEV
jgi:hypothetical protein